MTDTPIASPTAPVRDSSRIFLIATVLSSLVIGLPILVGRIVEAVLDTANPAGVDTSAGLAYLREILTWSFTSVGVLLVVVIVLLTILYRRAKTLDAIALPLLILAVQIVVGVVALLLSSLAA